MSKKLTFNNMAFNCITNNKFVTDKNLNPLCEGLNIVIHQPDHILDGMGEWCTKNHGESGRKNYFLLKFRNSSSSIIFSLISVQFN